MGTNRVNVRFPNEVDILDGMNRTTAFHSVDGRPLYKDASGIIHDPIQQLRDLVQTLTGVDGDINADILALTNEISAMKSDLGTMSTNDIIARDAILNMQMVLNELQVTDFLNKTGVGYYDFFIDTNGVDTPNTTATISEGKVLFGDTVQVLDMKSQTFNLFTEIELAIYDELREVHTLALTSTDSSDLDIDMVPGELEVGDKVYINGEIYTISAVAEVL